jgi:hypothetical protein
MNWEVGAYGAKGERGVGKTARSTISNLKSESKGGEEGRADYVAMTAPPFRLTLLLLWGTGNEGTVTSFPTEWG